MIVVREVLDYEFIQLLSLHCSHYQHFENLLSTCDLAISDLEIIVLFFDGLGR
jgi:hypothetical protein